MKLNNSDVLPGVLDDFLAHFVGYLKSALPDAQELLISGVVDLMKENASMLQKWTAMTAAGTLSTTDLKWLIQSNLDLSGLIALQKEGLTLVKMDDLRRAVVSSIVSGIFKIHILK
jgi:hypothetical protein